MEEHKLKSQFTEEFFEEFQYDAEFRSIFFSMDGKGLTPYQAIEHLCKSKKELIKTLTNLLANTPTRILQPEYPLKDRTNKRI